MSPETFATLRAYERITALRAELAALKDRLQAVERENDGLRAAAATARANALEEAAMIASAIGRRAMGDYVAADLRRAARTTEPAR